MIIPGIELITTDRLLLREYTPEASKLLFTNGSDDEIIEYLGLKDQNDLEIEKDRFRKGLSTFNRSFCYFHLILKNEGIVIGWCGFHTYYTSHNRAEVGYVMNDDIHKNKGYMKEALPPVLKFGFEKMKLNRVEAFIASYNTPSFKLLEANKFRQEGILKEHYFVNGKHEDSLLFALLSSEFEKN